MMNKRQYRKVLKQLEEGEPTTRAQHKVALKELRAIVRTLKEMTK